MFSFARSGVKLSCSLFLHFFLYSSVKVHLSCIALLPPSQANRLHFSLHCRRVFPRVFYSKKKHSRLCSSKYTSILQSNNFLSRFEEPEMVDDVKIRRFSQKLSHTFMVSIESYQDGRRWVSMQRQEILCCGGDLPPQSTSFRVAASWVATFLRPQEDSDDQQILEHSQSVSATRRHCDTLCNHSEVLCCYP